MTAGAIVLMALDNESLTGGAFSLASYTSLNPVEKVVGVGISLSPDSWSRIEVYSSEGDTEELAELIGLDNSQINNSHFIIYNGKGGKDGFIQGTKKWRRKEDCASEQFWYDQGRTIRICLLSNSTDGKCTDCQIKRAAALVESLGRKFDISREQVTYPVGWQM